MALNTAVSTGAFLSRLLFVRPVPVLAHAPGVVRQGNAPLMTRRPRWVSAGAPVADRNTASMQEERSGTPVHMVRDGVDVSRARRDAGNGPLLCIPRLVPRKGIDTLITAFGLLADDRPDLVLEVVGEGPFAAAMRGQARAVGLADRVDFRGPLPSADVQAALDRCAMLVLPGPVETGDRYSLPPVLLGAMACGAPVVTTDTVGLPELVRHDATGLLVAPDHPAGLAVAMATLLDDPIRAAALGGAGRRLVERLHDRDRSAARLQRIWQEMGR